MTNIQGTAFFVHGSWYIRHLGGGGSMLLIEADTDVKSALRDNKMVTVSGHLSADGQGCPQKITATQAGPIGA